MRTWLAHATVGTVMIVAAAAHGEGLSVRAVGPMVQGFPTTVPPGEAAAPGKYRGSVRLFADGRAPATIPIELTVHAFALPRTSSLPVTFGFAARAVDKAHAGLAPAAARALVERYQVAALRHRVSLHGGT